LLFRAPYYFRIFQRKTRFQPLSTAPSRSRLGMKCRDINNRAGK